MRKYSMGKHSLAVFTLALLHAGMVQAAPVTFTATLTGSAEAPPNESPATGVATVIYDDAARTLFVEASFSGLEGPTTAAHIHCCVEPPGTIPPATEVPSFTGFPLGVTAGVFSGTFDLTLESSFNPDFITATGGTIAGAEEALAAGLASGQAYFNIHTTAHPAGEIRGFLRTVPEPEALSIIGLALGMLIVARTRH